MLKVIDCQRFCPVFSLFDVKYSCKGKDLILREKIGRWQHDNINCVLVASNDRCEIVVGNGVERDSAGFYCDFDEIHRWLFNVKLHLLI